MQIANFAIGYFTIAIAVHSFNSLVLKMRPSVILRRLVMSIGWIVAILGGEWTGMVPIITLYLKVD